MRIRAVWGRFKADKVNLAVLSPITIEAWKTDFFKKAGDGPVEQQSAGRNVNYYIRNARSLFGKKVQRKFKELGLSAVVNPFEGVELERQGSTRYISTINPDELPLGHLSPMRFSPGVQRAGFGHKILALPIASHRAGRLAGRRDEPNILQRNAKSAFSLLSEPSFVMNGATSSKFLISIKPVCPMIAARTTKISLRGHPGFVSLTHEDFCSSRPTMRAPRRLTLGAGHCIIGR
jgi:hypothetical protein